jgi:homopolymeric O-antigen transport system permease protein
LDHTAPEAARDGRSPVRRDRGRGTSDGRRPDGPVSYRSCGGTCRPTSRARDDGLAKGPRVRSEVGSGARDPAATHESTGGAPVPPGRATPTIIEPIRGWPRPDLRELLRYRELLYFLVWRNIKVRYKQTAIGAAWAVLQPFLATIVVVLVFGGLLGVQSGPVPYAVFAFTGLLVWTYVSASVAGASASLVNEANLLTKVYFPRLIVPMSAVIAPAVDLGIGGLFLIVIMAVSGVTPGPEIVALPLFLALALLTALALGVWLAALNVRYRDIGHIVPFFLQVWFFVTPVAYPTSTVPEEWRALYGLNPMAGVIEGTRWALFGMPPPGPFVVVSALMMVAVLVAGLVYVRRTESSFADVV